MNIIFLVTGADITDQILLVNLVVLQYLQLDMTTPLEECRPLLLCRSMFYYAVRLGAHGAGLVVS